MNDQSAFPKFLAWTLAIEWLVPAVIGFSFGVLTGVAVGITWLVANYIFYNIARSANLLRYLVAAVLFAVVVALLYGAFVAVEMWFSQPDGHARQLAFDAIRSAAIRVAIGMFLFAIFSKVCGLLIAMLIDAVLCSRVEQRRASRLARTVPKVDKNR